MKPADVFIAVLVAVIWGLAFVASRIALDEFSPELMTTLRFGIAAMPCLFVRKPDVSWPLLIPMRSSLLLAPSRRPPLRFATAATPRLVVRKPDVSWPLLIAISFSLFLGQFLAQAFAIAQGVPVGLSSAIVRSPGRFPLAVC